MDVLLVLRYLPKDRAMRLNFYEGITEKRAEEIKRWCDEVTRQGYIDRIEVYYLHERQIEAVYTNTLKGKTNVD